ncbi:MAG TPA: class I SAM-dependent methyltransferase [Terriglobales bacterium]|nr:class I SAM-dependent methyltransferase [Terriglobales bacterium]
MDSTLRFTDRVESYVKARPGYPREIIQLLERKCGLTHASTVVDVGSGTGLLAKVFCDYGCRVIGIEPNDAMRAAGQQFLSGYSNFGMKMGTAESIPLPGTSVDFITAGQAFHWFDLKQARHEFMRILKPNGWTALVWNNREQAGSKFAEEYESLLARFGTDYAQVDHRNRATPSILEEFFGNGAFSRGVFPNDQRLNHERFIARILSSSYMPQPGSPNYGAMMQEIERIFRENQKDGIVVMQYDTNVYYGQMS